MNISTMNYNMSEFVASVEQHTPDFVVFDDLVSGVTVHSVYFIENAGKKEIKIQDQSIDKFLNHNEYFDKHTFIRGFTLVKK